MQDPNPLVGGDGLHKLQAAGLQVECGLLENEARKVIPGFVARMTRGRGLATLVVATLLLVGCASTPQNGIVHVLKPGENLYRLSRYYGVSVKRIERANRIGDETEAAAARARWQELRDQNLPARTTGDLP